MHDRGAAGTYFDGTHPGVLFERIRNEECLDLAGALRRNIVRLRHRNDHVRFDAPSFRPFDWGRLIFGVAFGCSTVRPCGECFDVGFGQWGCVPKASIMRVGEPWRHLFTENRFLDCLRPRASAVVSQERHWRDFTRPMTLLTI